MSAVRAGAIPAQYRDLVIDYFDREASDPK
jgi:hypothetical protein